MTPTPEEFENRWKSHINQLERLRLSASGDDFERISEIEGELIEIVESITEERRE